MKRMMVRYKVKPDRVAEKRTMMWFLIWLVVGFGISATHLLNIGNVAHLSGLVFGVLLAAHAHAWQKGQTLRASLVRAGTALLLAAAIVPLVWAPWSVVWLSNQAYRAHVDKRYTEALSYYDQVIELNPQDAWAFVNRSRVYQALGATGKAQADFERAAHLDPSIVQRQ